MASKAAWVFTIKLMVVDVGLTFALMLAYIAAHVPLLTLIPLFWLAVIVSNVIIFKKRTKADSSDPSVQMPTPWGKFCLYATGAIFATGAMNGVFQILVKKTIPLAVLPVLGINVLVSFYCFKVARSKPKQNR